MKKVVVVAIIIGFLFAFAPTQARSGEMVLKAVTMFPKGHLNNDPVPIFVEKVNKAAKGRLKIDWVGGPEVIKGFDQPHAMKAGTIDMILYMAFAYCKSLMPEAEAKGLSERHILWKYAFRNCLLTQVTGLALSLGNMVGGSLITEMIFAYPGVGYLLFQAIRNLDYPVVQGVILIVILSLCSALLVSLLVLRGSQGVILIVILSLCSALLIIDLIYPLIDPRIRYGEM